MIPNSLIEKRIWSKEFDQRYSIEVKGRRKSLHRLLVRDHEGRTESW